MLVDEPEEDETEANVEEDHERLSPKTEQLLKSIDDTLEEGKSASKVVVDDEEKSLSGSEDDVDAEVDRWIKENFDPRERERERERESNKRKERGVQLTMMMKLMYLQKMFRLYHHHHQEVERNQLREKVT
ncbi:hypothetical protein Hanom_Chr17g01589251 [Helianthus anomalus]